MVNDFKIKKYWFLTFCMVLCSLVTFAQDLSDQQIGFDVARVTTSLKERGVSDQEISQEIAMMREMQKRQYVEMKKSEEAILNKIRSEQKAKVTTNKSSAVTDIPQSEKDALKALYDATGGDNWTNSISNSGKWDFNKPVTSWNPSTKTGWYGVTVGSDGRVISINLHSNNLNNLSVPFPNLGSLASLEMLSLHYNKLLTGSLNNFQYLTSLKYLNLNSNDFTDNLLPIRTLINLEYLIIANNKNITGNIPEEIYSFKNLKDLSISSNNLTGSISSKIGNLLKLETLNTHSNRNLEGIIPTEIGNLINLTHLDLSGSKLSGIIPPSIGNLINLLRLTLAWNYTLEGEIPDSLGNLNKLKSIWIQSNKLSGVIPNSIGNLNYLISLVLSRNKLEGIIPVSFKSLSKLNFLSLDDNNFTGTLPDLTNLAQLSGLRINTNKFYFADFAKEFPTYKRRFSIFDYSPQSKTDIIQTAVGSVGSTVTLSMFEDNRFTPEDTFQWYKGVSPNGVLIPGATFREYTITSLKETDAGNYYCVSKHPEITNPNVSTQNLVLERNPITLKVVKCTPKTGELKLPTQQVFVGESAKFSFEQTAGTVIAGEVVNYKWTIADSAGKTVNSTTTAVGVHSFIFPSDGKYSVKVVVTGADGCEATFPQEMTILPEKKCLNENLSFSFDTKSPNLSYVWTSTNASGTVVNTSPASTSSLYNVTFAIAGVYTISMVATDMVTQCFETFTKKVTIDSCAPTNCMVHFNFNFKIPDNDPRIGGTILNLNSRMNIANGVVDFLKANTNKKLFATTFDMTDKGVNAVLVNKEITVSPGDVYKVVGGNEISNTTPTVIRIQDNSYSNTFSTLINNGILQNTLLKKDGVDVSFFIISEDHNTASLDAARNAYKNLLNSGKAKKVFFVFVNEGKFSYIQRVGLTNRIVSISPTQFLAEIKGAPPVNYTTTNSILSADFVQFSQKDIANVGFRKVFYDFLQKGYNDIKSNCEDIESCTKKNDNTPVLKKLFLTLVNKLKDIPAGSDANVYAKKELVALSHYTVDKKATIYNFINTSTSISFAFTETSLENDVLIAKPALGSIVDIDLSQYTDMTTKTPVTTLISGGKVDLKAGFVRNIDFCISELSCVSHVALVLDESGSIDQKEMNKIKKQLKGFVYQQALNNEKNGSNIHVSLTGMSDSDTYIRTDYVAPTKISTDPLDLKKFYDWIDNLGMRNGKTGVSAGSDYWKSGLDGALSYSLKPNVVIMITDGCQTATTEGLRSTMKQFNNYKGNSAELPHLYVVGIENGFYVDNPSSARTLSRSEDPNYNLGLVSKSSTAKVAARLTKSLQFLLGFSETEFPVSDINDFKGATYFGHDNFNLLSSDEIYISKNLTNEGNRIICGDFDDPVFCEDCFSFKPEPKEEYLLSAWVKEESIVQVKSYLNASIKIVFYRQKEALDSHEIKEARIEAKPSGEIIDGWQRIFVKFKVHAAAITIGFSLENKSASIPVYFDDIRIHPLNGSVKSFVYDAETFKLMSELDENNYSTYYEYDNEGGLVRVKKETAKGVKTIQETRSGNVINTDK
jgi:Leucine-rich repeat (LRR) protein